MGKNSRKNTVVCSGVLYIFQLAAISFFLTGRTFSNAGMVKRTFDYRAWERRRRSGDFEAHRPCQLGLALVVGPELRSLQLQGTCNMQGVEGTES